MICSRSYTNFSRQIPHAMLISCYLLPASLNRLIYINHTDTCPYNIIIQPLPRSAKHAATGMSCEPLLPLWVSTNLGCKTTPTLSFARCWREQQHTRRFLRALPLSAYKLKVPSRFLFLLMNRYRSPTGFSAHLQEKWSCIPNRL